jgi:ATP-binding cassette subfamily F protein 3
VLELEAGRSTYFAGPWHNWRREKAARLSAATTAAQRVDVDIARLERFVARFRYKKSLAKRAQAKLTHIGRLQKERAELGGEISLLTRRAKSLGFDFLQPKRSGRTVAEVEGAKLAAGDKLLLTDVSFAIERGEHVALVGPNGSGKTTLLETLLDRREPVAGKLRFGHGVEPAYFSQHEIELDETRSVLAATQNATGLQRPQAQNLLGRFLFSGWEMHERPVAALSGGERRRLALALVVASGSNLLLLDEPTNHLDIPAREAIEAFMTASPATLLVVSHDRRLLETICTKLWVVDGGLAAAFDGGYREWRAAVAGGWTVAEAASRPPAASGLGPRAAVGVGAGVGARVAAGVGLGAPAVARPPTTRRAKRDKLSKDAYRRQKAIVDADLSRLGLRKSHLELAMADPTVASNFVELRRISSELVDVDRALAMAENAWLELEERAP